MRERPILFSGPMVRALLDGRKTQTRRVVKASGGRAFELGMETPEFRASLPARCPYGVPGDRLWVKHRADLFPVYWRPIPGWEGVYAAGTDGVVYRMDRGEPSPLKPSPTGGKGYPSVSLSRGGEWTTYLVHRLVCAAFYGREPFDGAQVRHLDGDQNNSRPENLDWGTQEQNWQDRKAHGRGMGEAHHASKLTAEQVVAIRQSTRSQRALAAQYGVSQSTIGEVRTGGTWGEHEPAPRNAPGFRLWTTPLFMPRWASRLTLELTDVRVERVQDISEEDTRAEGVYPLPAGTDDDGAHYDASDYHTAFLSLFYDLNKRAPRTENPWVWAITFKRIDA